MRLDFCEYGNHPQKNNRGYFYRDIKNGLEKEVTICPSCYAKHILKFYPKSKMALYINQHPDEFL